MSSLSAFACTYSWNCSCSEKDPSGLKPLLFALLLPRSQYSSLKLWGLLLPATGLLLMVHTAGFVDLHTSFVLESCSLTWRAVNPSLQDENRQALRRSYTRNTVSRLGLRRHLRGSTAPTIRYTPAQYSIRSRGSGAARARTDTPQESPI